MYMADLSKDILKKIEEKDIQPISKKYFFFKRSVIWTLFGISIILGCFSSSVALFQIKRADWDLYHQLGDSLIEFLLLVAPYFWIFFLICFTVLVYFYFRKTERGYRYSTAVILLISIFVSFVGGEVLYHTGFPEKLEKVFTEKVPFYPEINDQRHRMWRVPEKGLLAGRISEIISSQEIELIDLENKKWLVDISTAFWRGRLVPEENLMIKMIGTMTEQGRFTAQEIRPWFGRGQRRMMNRNRPRNYYNRNN